MKRFLAQVLVMTMSAACFTQAAFAHAFPDHAEPKVGSTVGSSPVEVKVWFNDDIQADNSDIEVFDASGKEVDKKDSRGDPKDKTLLRVSVGGLKEGTYKVVWHAVCLDLHHTSGAFEFSIKAGG